MKLPALLLSGFLLLIFLPAKPQVFARKPYLKITNTITGEVFKLRPGKKVRFSVVNDSNVFDARIYGLGDSTVKFEDLPIVRCGHIDYIKFKPVNKFKQVLKGLYYFSWAWVCAYAFTHPCQDAGCPNQAFLVIIYTPFVVLIGETGGGIIQLLTPKKEFFKDRNLKIEAVR